MVSPLIVLTTLAIALFFFFLFDGSRNNKGRGKSATNVKLLNAFVNILNKLGLSSSSFGIITQKIINQNSKNMPGEAHRQNFGNKGRNMLDEAPTKAISMHTTKKGNRLISILRIDAIRFLDNVCQISFYIHL